MSYYGSQKNLSMSRRAGSKGDLSGGMTQQYVRNEVFHGGGNGYEPYMEGYNTYSYSKSSMGGMAGGQMSGMGGGMSSGMSGGMGGGMGGGMSAAGLTAIHQRAMGLQAQCQEYLKKAEYALQSGNTPGEAERYMGMAKETIEQLKACAIDLRQLGQPNDNVVARTLELCKDQLKGVHMAITGTMRRKSRASSGAWEEPGRSFHDAMAWIAQQKRLIETAPWGDDSATIDQQLISHQRFHSSIQRSIEMDRARDDLMKKGDKASLNALEQEWDSLQQISFGRTKQLQELQQIIQEMSKEIMWVNSKEEEELVFDWGDKNIDQYIPRKQESYSKLMSALEDKEKDLNKLKAKVDTLLKNNHPASDKIEAYRDTLQTQWSWLLQITKCIDVHLKENAAYSQFFKEANETYSNLQREHETVRKNFTCDKNTSLEDLLGLLKGLEREKEKIQENKRQVQHLVSRSKNIVRLKPRNPEEKSGSPVIVKALCDFRQDQKVINKGNEAILKDNSQRSKWDVTGPGGLDMSVPSVCLIIPPPNPLSVSLANKNEQYYEAILTIWNQLYINVKSLIAWQYCLLDIQRINSLTITMLAQMRPEEYRQIIKSLETHFQEFKLSCHGSQMFADDDKRALENQFNGAQAHYEQLVVQLPTYIAQQGQIEVEEQLRQQQLILIQQQQAQAAAAAAEEAMRLEEERRRAEQRRQTERQVKNEEAKVIKTDGGKRKTSSSSASSSSRSLSELHALRLRLEAAEGTLCQHVHICCGDDAVHDCGLKIIELEMVQRDIDSMREEYLRLRERISKELEGMNDSDKAQFLRSEIVVINDKLGGLESSSSAYLQRLQALKDMLESVARVEDIVKVHEARLTEKETTSLLPGEVEDYILTLKNIKAELDEKKDVLASMETELAKASHWNSQAGGSSHRCDMMLSKYTELVSLLSDRWRRILGQIDTRLQDLQSYHPQLQHYKKTSTSLIDWIDATRKQQDALQATRIDTIQALNDHINKQKALNLEIKLKRETVDSVLKDNGVCVSSIKDYETDLASYASGLETLLNIPIKRTMLKSPSMDLNQEAIEMQTRYMELLTLSGDHYKFLGELLRNMEELKIRNTRIDVLEEQLRSLREDIHDRDAKNRSLEDTIARYKRELSHSQDQLTLIEEVKCSATKQCSATRESLDSTQSKLADLSDQVTRLNYLLDEEKRKRRLAEERYTQQQQEYDLVLKKRQKELETVSWSKMEVEKTVVTKERELELLRRQLAEEAARVKELQREVSKTTATLQTIQSQYNEIVMERDALLRKLQFSETDKDRLKWLEEELSRIKLSLESELRNKQRLQEENERVKRDLDYWKDQYESKQGVLRQCDTEKERMEREKNSLKSDIERLMRELRELEETYKSRLTAVQKELREVQIARQAMETELKKAREPQGLDASTLVFDGVRKSVTANQLLDCGVLDKSTFNQLVKGHRTVPDVSADKKISLKGTGPIAGVLIEGSKGSITGPLYKMSFTEAKRENLLPPDSVDLLLDAQAATGHIIDPRTNQKLTVQEACDQGVVDEEDRERLLAAEAAAVGYSGPGTSKPLSAFQAMKKGLMDKNTTLRLLQAQESVGGILDPVLSVFLPKDTAIERNLIDDDIYRTLNRKPELYLDPEREEGVSYMSLKRQCKVEPHTGLLLLPISEKVDPSKLVFDGVRKPVTAQQLLDCGVLDKPTFNQLMKGEKSVSEVSVDKKVFLKGTGPISGVAAGPLGKMSLSEAKKQMLMPADSADLLLEAQAATGHIIDPTSNQKLTVEEACARGVVDNRDRDRLLAAEAAAVGYRDPRTAKSLSVFEAMKKGLIDQKTGLRLLQAQESAGGILDPNLSVFLPKDTAIKRGLLDEELYRALSKAPGCYIDPDTERDASYGALKNRCKTEFHTGLILLPITERKDPSKLIFDGVRKPVSAQQLFECGVLDKPTLNQLVKGEKTVPTVSEDKMVYLKGTGPIAGVVAGCHGKMSLSEAKKQKLLSEESADLLLAAQAATGHIIDPKNGQKLTVEEACARGVVDIKDRDRLLAAEGAAVGYRDPSAAKLLSVFEALNKGLIDRKTGLRLLQAQESVGGILDPNLSVFLPKDTAIRRNLLDENLRHALNQSPACYLDPETGRDVSYGALKERCKTEPHTGLQLLPVSEKVDPSKLIFDGIRKTVTAQQLLDCGLLDKPTFNRLMKGEKTVSEVSVDMKVFLRGTGSIAGVAAGPLRKMSFTEAKKQNIMSSDSADMLLYAQAVTGQIIDPRTNQKMTVKEACARGVVDKEDESKLYAAEAAAIGYRDPYNAATLLSAGQAMKKGIIDKDTALRVLQAQQSVGGILDPTLSVFLPKDIAKARGLIDDELYQALNQYPKYYLDPDTQQATDYVSLKKKCKADPSTGLLLLPEPKKPITVQGLRGQVSVTDLVDANLLKCSDMDQLREGRLTSQDIEHRLRSYLRGSTCIAGVYDEASDKTMSFYQAMKEELLRPGTTLELLEAQAASGFIVDPINNLYLTVSDAYNRRLFGSEFKDNLLSAERAVTGYKLPCTDKIISLFEAIERGLVEKGHGIRLLEAQIASGGIIDPERSHRIDVNVAYKRGYFDEKMNRILSDGSVDSKGFFDPNTEENLTYRELKERCITDKKTGLMLLPIMDKKKQESTLKNTLRKRRVVIVDPETNKEMTVREAYDKGYIDYATFLELSEQECEWEEITITAPDGSTRFVIIDRKTGRQYDITELLEKRVINQSDLDQYRSRAITLTQFADIITNKTKHESSLSSSSTSRPSAASDTSSVTSSSFTSRTSTSTGTGSSMTSSSTLRTSDASVPSSATSSSSSSSLLQRPLSPTLAKMTTTKTTTITGRSATFSSSSSGSQELPDCLRNISSVSFSLASPSATMGEQEPVGAIFDTETVEKISISEALNRGLVDSITAQRLLEAQACTGGIINPTNGQRLSIQEASRQGIISDDMASKLKPAQKAYFGFEDVKARKKMSAAEAMKEMWLPYEAGQRFMEFQFVTGGLHDPEMGCRRNLEDALRKNWLDERTAQKLQDISHHTKNLTCPKSKLKISYKEALDNCLVEESTGVKMLQASSVSSRGISSPYNVSSAPGSTTGSRSGSRRSSRRSSVDLGSPLSTPSGRFGQYSLNTFSAFSR